MSEDRELRQNGGLTDPTAPDAGKEDPGKQDRSRKKQKTRFLLRSCSGDYLSSGSMMWRPSMTCVSRGL